MKALAQYIHTRTAHAQWLEWGRLITLTGSAQIAVQAIGLISGILVIRLLSTGEYALYTLANTMLGTMTVLADGGISSGVMAQGGKVWQDRQKLGAVMATGLQLRRTFGAVSLVVSVPVLFYLLHQHGADWLTAGLIVAALIPAFLAGLTGELLKVAPSLRQDIPVLQKNNVAVNLGRLALLLPGLLVFPFASVAILAAGIPQVFGNTHIKKISEGYADWRQASDPELRKQILKFVQRILPGSIYYCLSGQITIWLISLLGTTTAVAQIGALGRLAVVLTLINTVFGTLIAPRFARLDNQKGLLVGAYIKIHVALVAICLVIVGFVWLFQTQILWLLGSEYMGLGHELVLNTIGSCIGLIAGISFRIYTSRGWAIAPVLSIPINFLSILIGVYAIDLSTLAGVLYFNIFISVVQAIINGSYGMIKVLKS
ncbi:MATE family efflux transporter [Tellurirhabdus rosea]|uniref:polysaccharide biosynthesis protein n=1 Tax=Tellurirhabdus rosea TaxID=2674997 RepID=UPI0022599B9D|nr:polysaccharide biosynthesis protein [Tellurirhabdus rosea]